MTNVVIRNAKTTMTPVSIKNVPKRLYGFKCHICEKDTDKEAGACINCNAVKCRRNLHVTCAQQAGTLQEKVDGNGGLSFIVFCPDHLNASASRISINSIEKVLETRKKVTDIAKAKASNSDWVIKSPVNKVIKYFWYSSF